MLDRLDGFCALDDCLGVLEALNSVVQSHVGGADSESQNHDDQKDLECLEHL